MSNTRTSETFPAKMVEMKDQAANLEMDVDAIDITGDGGVMKVGLAR